jgi:hypothetical protein
MMLKKEKDFDHFWNILSPRWSPALTPVKVQFGAAPAAADAPAKPTRMPNEGRVLLYSTQDGPVQLQAHNVHPGPSFLMYVIDEVTDQSTRQMQTGILYDGLTITFNAKAQTAYYFYAQPNGLRPPPQVTWELSIPNAAVAKATLQDGVIHLQGRSAPLSVYASRRAHVSAQADANGVLLRTGKQAVDRTGVPDE